MRRIHHLLRLMLLLSVLVSPGHAAELVMFEASDCPWCARWHEEIGSIYPKTEESAEMPLRRVDIHDRRPDDLLGIKGIVYTPTFVLMDGGREIGRITGYPGEDHFWGLLGVLREKYKKSAVRDGD